MTIGILFFGTPQQEIRWDRWSELLAKIFRAAILIPLSGTIQYLADQVDFSDLQINRYKSIESNFLNFSFLEEAKIRIDGSKLAWVNSKPLFWG